MSDSKVYTVIGLMSGTSFDGVDAALMKTNGQGFTEVMQAHSIPYNDKIKQKIRGCLGKSNLQDPDVQETARQLTFVHAEVVDALLTKSGLKAADVDVIGFHGQTIFHDPEKKKTVQIGDGELLAKKTGISVVNDFRSADVAAGGQGAPFLPLYHWAKMNRYKGEYPIAVLNIGGVSNVTWIGEDASDILAFDTGPGNALIDDFIFAKTGKHFDEDGKIAASGMINDKLLQTWLVQKYFTLPVPKSLDRDAWDVSGVDLLSSKDGAATLTAFTVQSIALSQKYMKQAPKAWFVAGGGRHNKTIMDGLQKALQGDVKSVDELGWNGDTLEAEGFAYLAVRSLLGLPLSLPSTTGVPKPVTGGVLHKAA